MSERGSAALACLVALLIGSVPFSRLAKADQPVRIVTLAPSLGELAADLSGEHLERIVGVSEFTDYPPALARVSSVGPYQRFNLEKVVALKPDLVLATTDGNSKDQVTHLQELGIRVLVINTSTLSEVESSMRLVGRAMGVPEDGEKMAARFAAGLRNFRSRAEHREAPKARVMLQLGEDPLIVAGKGSFLNEALELLGAQNIYGQGSGQEHYPRPAIEDVIHRDPDTILVLALGHDRAGTETSAAMASHWNRFATLSAVKAHRCQVLQADALLRPSLRLLEGLSLLEKAVYAKK